MSYTLGCQAEHVTVGVSWRAGAAMAADQGDEDVRWDWPITTNMPPQHHRPHRTPDID